MNRNENELSLMKAIAQFEKDLEFANMKSDYVSPSNRKTKVNLKKEKTVYDIESKRWMSVAEYHTRVAERQNLEAKKEK